MEDFREFKAKEYTMNGSDSDMEQKSGVQPGEDQVDYIVQATALGGMVQAVSVRSTRTCRELAQIHSLSPVSAAALGRVCSALFIMSRDLKGNEGSVSAAVRCDGEIGGIFAICTSDAKVRGYVSNPLAETFYKSEGKLDVGHAVGSGTLTVVKDLGLKEPYSGQIELVSGEIAEDFASYYMLSEQIPSVISLGVGMSRDGITSAGGLMIRILPDAGEDIIRYLERRAAGFPQISWLLEEGFTPEQIIDLFLGDPEIQYYDRTPCRQECTCSRDRMLRNLITLGHDELESLLDDPADLELNCHFCNSTYRFSNSDLKKIIGDM
ncbi:MAG: Hsp33 family molecular chaperone HslO [Saccharofermentanales bacterium]